MLFLGFGDNKEIVDFLKKDCYSIGIDSEFADKNYYLFEGAREEINFKQNFVFGFASIEEVKYIYAEYIEQLHRWNYSEKAFPGPLDLYRDFVSSLNYWFNFLKYYDIQKIFIYEDPHRGFDLLIYALAKKMNIKFYIFSELTTGYRTFIKQNISDSLKDVNGEFKKTDTSIDVSLKYNHIHHQFLSDRYEVKRFLLRFIKLHKLVKLFIKSDTYIYKDNKPYSSLMLIQYQFWLNRRYIRTIKYRYHLKKNIRDVKLNSGDIVFYLHYQPERTSNPLAESAREQLHCLKMLVKAFPLKKVYVKEHPSQLNLTNTHANRQIRDKKFIDKINYICDGFVDKVNTEANIIVATLHGTAGLEFALNGNSVLCFGNPWYDFLDNVEVIKNLDDLLKIVNRVHDKKLISNSLKNMLYKKSAKGSISHKYENMVQHNNPQTNYELMNYIEWYFKNN